MGLYNTYIFSQPLYCPYCGEKHENLQSHLINSSKFATYKVGDVVGKETDNIIREEEYYCETPDDNHKYHSKCSWIRSKLLNLGERSQYSATSKETYIVPNTYPHYFYITLKAGIYVGTVASRQDAELLGEFSDEDCYEFDFG